ncbi:hypothetical protein D9619_005448 [Psilocybe cf. subviscida]|uniref:Uncharacterized protein n=1 Tax=Psilocybe cf. subviscida TaxID=2480587 RepID=A0A8H5FBL1_9AGAR|nr:hypothetical protein D9619_005448 [Psilocybe cf. subviscida]
MQNMRHSRTHLVSVRNYNSPTLPIRLTALDDIDTDEAGPIVQPVVLPTYSGPAPPKSWRPSYEVSDSNSVEWRKRALSIAASHLGNFVTTPRVPSLALLCLQMILSSSTNTSEFRQDIVPYIPPHLRRDVIRYCAIHAPLPNWKLYALLDHGNADGEMLVMGPVASLRDHSFIREGTLDEEAETPPEVIIRRPQHDWETEDNTEMPLTSLLLVSTRLPTSTMLSFPSTITRMALVNLSNSISLHQLPKTCPLLVVLDLSYNSWLKNPGKEEHQSLVKIAWSRWSHLEVLGLRDCNIPDALLNRINEGRWDDVMIIRE